MVFSQGTGGSGNVGFPDISKLKTIAFSGNPYVIPEDGWILDIQTSRSYQNSHSGGGGSSIGWRAYSIYWYVNNNQLWGKYCPFPVKKGDVIRAYNTYTERCNDVSMEYVPNRK